VAAVAAAGIAIGAVFGYAAGRRAVPIEAPAAISSSPTDVPVTPSAAPDGQPSTSGAGPGDAADGRNDDATPADPVEAPDPVEPVVRSVDRPRGGGPGAAVDSGRLVVRSTPPGALVLVDGRSRGQTPLTVSNLALGAHTVEVARSGYVPHTQQIVLTARGPSQTVSVRLRAGLPMEGR
jgi:hypothetical protein